MKQIAFTRRALLHGMAGVAAAAAAGRIPGVSAAVLSSFGMVSAEQSQS